MAMISYAFVNRVLLCSVHILYLLYWVEDNEWIALMGAQNWNNCLGHSVEFAATRLTIVDSGLEALKMELVQSWWRRGLTSGECYRASMFRGNVPLSSSCHKQQWATYPACEFPGGISLFTSGNMMLDVVQLQKHFTHRKVHQVAACVAIKIVQLPGVFMRRNSWQYWGAAVTLYSPMV